MPPGEASTPPAPTSREAVCAIRHRACVAQISAPQRPWRSCHAIITAAIQHPPLNPRRNRWASSSDGVATSPAAISATNSTLFGDGARLVWLPVSDEDAWVAAEVSGPAAAGGAVQVKRLHAPDGVARNMTITQAELDDLMPVSGRLDTPVADLTHLETISTAAVLHTLRQRHAAQHIYTAVGPIILALNPFAPTAECTPQRLAELAACEEPDTLPPHVFSIARSAYTVLSRTGGSQAILISGESGAGKTETAKIVMSCLAQLSSSSAHATSVALESGLLLEAFGNSDDAQPNSSRFGKWCGAL